MDKKIAFITGGNRGLGLETARELSQQGVHVVIGSRDKKAGESAVRELLIAVGEDPDRDGLRATPARVARAYAEVFAGLHVDPSEVLTTTFDENHDELVLVKDIPLYSTCEHHLVPWHGSAAVG